MRFTGLLVCLLLLLWNVASAQAQRLTRPVPTTLALTLTKAQVLEDLTLFQQVKERAHAGIYKYRTKVQMDSAFAAVRAQAREGMTIQEIYRLLVRVTDFEGSLHNDTTLPDSLRHRLDRQATFFPYPVKLIAGKLLLDYAHGPLPVGTEVVAVDGRSVAQLTQALGRYYTTDGFNQTGKQRALDTYFARYYQDEFGPQSTFAVTVRRPGNSTTQLLHWEAVDYATSQQRYRRRHSQRVDSLMTPQGKYQYGLEIIGSAAVLTVRTFDIGDNAQAPAHKAYRRFLDSCFTLINTTPTIQGVLIDVRGNGGGSDPNDVLTFRYLAQRPFRENQSAFILFQHYPHWPYLQSDHRGLRRWQERAVGEWELRQEFTLDSAGRYYQHDRANQPYNPSPLRTTLPLYLLVDRDVASAASLFAALVRGNTDAVVIGEETSGGYYGHTGHTPVAYRLPHTGIVTQFSLVDLEQDVPIKTTQPVGHGIMPDYPVTQSINDFLANRDTQREYALRLMSQQAAARKATK